MAYAALPSKSAGDTITLTNYTTIKSNFEAGVPDLMAARGDLAVATAADAAARLAAGADGDILVPSSGETTGMAWYTPYFCHVYNDADIDPATSSWVTLTFNSERSDDNGLHSTVSNASRITVPTGGGGVYHISTGVNFDLSTIASGFGVIGLRVLLNGTTVLRQIQHVNNQGALDFTLALSFDYTFSAADYIEVQVYTNEDVNITASGNYSPEFSARWVRT